jgi:hypothetical protein
MRFCKKNTQIMKRIILISFATLLTSVLFGQMTLEAYLNLVTDGLGESQPVVSNDTPVNKALNRRVEFINLLSLYTITCKLTPLKRMICWIIFLSGRPK